MKSIYSGIGYFSIILILLVTFQNCSPNFNTLSSAEKKQDITPTDSNPYVPETAPVLNPKTKGITPLAGKNISAVRFSYTSGTIAPQYQYSVGFKIDFQSKILTISVNKGTEATHNLPLPGTKGLTDKHISTIRTLLFGLYASDCDATPPPLGGGISSFSIFTTSLSRADSFVWIGNCQIFSEMATQYLSSDADSKALIEYIKSI